MNVRLKMFAAALGLIVAAGTIADASAEPIRRTVITKTVYAGHLHRHFGARFADHVRIVRRAPVAVRIVHRGPVLARVVHRGPTFVRVAKRTFVRHAMFNRSARPIFVR